MLSAIIALLGGLIAASSWIVARQPNAKQILDKISPFQGWIGIILLFWGIWGTIQLILHLNAFSLSWIISLAVCVIEFVVGFLLAYGLLSRYFFESNPTAKEKGDKLRLRLVRYQVPAGLILIVLAILAIIL